MEAYKIKTHISSEGKISLPTSLRHLFERMVEIIVLDDKNNKERKEDEVDPVELLEKYTLSYNSSDEPDLDIEEIYKNRL